MNKFTVFLLFFSAVILVYSGLNLYFYNLFKRYSLVSKGFRKPFLICMLLVAATLFMTSIFGRINLLTAAMITGYIGYSWLSFLFLFMTISIVLGIAALIIKKVLSLSGSSIFTAVFYFSVIASVGILVYSFYEANNIRVQTVAINSSRIDAGEKVKIMQISDVHFSPLTDIEMAKKIVEISKQIKPDIIVSTGDLLDPGIRNPKKITEIMCELNAPLGKYAVSGNHEFYAGIDISKEFTEASCFQFLQSRSVSAGKNIVIVGFDDHQAKVFTGKQEDIESTVFSKVSEDSYVVLLKHQPIITETSKGKFDIQMSGHTHGGQIFPFTYLVKTLFPYIEGYYQLDERSALYVSRGTGTWGPPFRFLAPAEITVFELTSE